MIIGGTAFTGSSGMDQLNHERDRQMRDRLIQAHPWKTYGRLMEALMLLVSLWSAVVGPAIVSLWLPCAPDLSLVQVK